MARAEELEACFDACHFPLELDSSQFTFVALASGKLQLQEPTVVLFKLGIDSAHLLHGAGGSLCFQETAD